MNPITVPVDVVPLLYSGLQLDIGHRIFPELQEGNPDLRELAHMRGDE